VADAGLDRPKNLLIVRALAGDSTITSDFFALVLPLDLPLDLPPAPAVFLPGFPDSELESDFVMREAH
jgi:hypothetical protein